MFFCWIILILAAFDHISGSCLKPNQAWLSDNILDTYQPVSDPYLCQAICAATDDCTAFTWTSEHNPQLQLFCFLFSTTYNQTSCQECVSGPVSCTCSSEVACPGDAGNTLDVIEDVLTEAECQDDCLENPECMFYTWYNGNSFPAHVCIILSSCEGTVPCHGCFSGTPECSQQLSTTTSAPVMQGEETFIFCFNNYILFFLYMGQTEALCF